MVMMIVQNFIIASTHYKIKSQQKTMTAKNPFKKMIVKVIKRNNEFFCSFVFQDSTKKKIMA